MTPKEFKQAMQQLNKAMPKNAALDRMPKQWGNAGKVNKTTLVQQPTRAEYVAEYRLFVAQHSNY